MTTTMPKTITLTNDFHHSSVTVRVPDDGILSVSQTRRVYKTLCGMKDCCCGGIRGRQEHTQGFAIDTYTHQDRIAVVDASEFVH